MSKINWQKFRDDAAVKIFSALLSNDGMYMRSTNNQSYGFRHPDEILILKARGYADKLTNELMNNPFKIKKKEDTEFV